jgi:hypothetical protein
VCEKCYALAELFKAADKNPHENYLPSIAFIEQLVKQGELELYAGDCPLEEIEKHLEEESHYTICHYFVCKQCNEYFFIGVCIRGRPIYKVKKDLKDENFNNILWGRCGTFYK